MPENVSVSARAHCASGEVHLQPHDGTDFVPGPDGKDDIGIEYSYAYGIDPDGVERVILFGDDGTPLATITGRDAYGFTNAMTFIGGILSRMSVDPRAQLAAKGLKHVSEAHGAKADDVLAAANAVLEQAGAKK